MKNKFFKKRNIFLAIILVGVIVSSFVFLPFGEKTWNYYLGINQGEDKKEDLTIKDLKTKNEFNNVAQAMGGLPFVFGGTVIKYNPACVLDNAGGTCEGSCSQCSRMVSQGCNAYQEILYMPVAGSDISTPPNTICVPKANAATVFKGGIPTPGGQILGGGASAQLPWVIGVSP